MNESLWTHYHVIIGHDAASILILPPHAARRKHKHTIDSNNRLSIRLEHPFEVGPWCRLLNVYTSTYSCWCGLSFQRHVSCVPPWAIHILPVKRILLHMRHRCFILCTFHYVVTFRTFGRLDWMLLTRLFAFCTLGTWNTRPNGIPPRFHPSLPSGSGTSWNPRILRVRRSWINDLPVLGECYMTVLEVRFLP